MHNRVYDNSSGSAVHFTITPNQKQIMCWTGLPQHELLSRQWSTELQVQQTVTSKKLVQVHAMRNKYLLRHSGYFNCYLTPYWLREMHYTNFNCIIRNVISFWNHDLFNNGNFTSVRLYVSQWQFRGFIITHSKPNKFISNSCSCVYTFRNS